MPSTSQKQHNLMALVANDPAAAKRLGIPQKVGKEFVRADKGRKFAEGGEMAESKAMMKKEVSFMKKKGAPASMIKHEKAEAGMKKGGYAVGGGIRGAGPVTRTGTPQEEFSPNYRTPVRSPKVLARGGGVEVKGKTKGKMVKMAYGGSCK